LPSFLIFLTLSSRCRVLKKSGQKRPVLKRWGNIAPILPDKGRGQFIATSYIASFFGQFLKEKKMSKKNSRALRTGYTLDANNRWFLDFNIKKT